jgi:DNA-binding SARP family transcriptional activator
VLFRVLGAVEVEADAGPVALGSVRERLVLALLLLRADRLTTTDGLIDAIWDRPPPSARQQLQNLVAGLRRRLGPEASGLVRTRPLGYELRLGHHTCDLHEFRHLCRRATGLAARGEQDAARAASEAALGLWRGEALADVPQAPVADAVRALEDERAAALEQLLEVLVRSGDHDEVLARTVDPLARDPWNERLHAHRLAALAATGRRAEALETYREVCRGFVAALGVPPGAALSGVVDRILAGDAGPPTVPTRPVPRELPPPAWSLVGRDVELAEVVASVRDAGASPAGAPPTVVLHGVGGAGKSALAVAAARVLAAGYPDGALWIPLTESTCARTPDALARALRSLGVAPRDVPRETEERTALYRTLLADRRVLVVLDGAASEQQVRPLLPTTSSSAALVTSRRRLAGLVGVARTDVGPLGPDSSTALLRALVGPARAAAEPEELRRIAELCGHLPLAVEVAGARLAAQVHLGAAELRSRLEREHARLDELRTGDVDVRASIAASTDDLGRGAARLLRGLATAPDGDWPTWVAEVLAATLAEPDDRTSWREAVDELVDAHLVEPVGRDDAGQARFRVPALVRALAAEQLAAHEGPTTADRLDRALLGHWTRLAALADRHLEEPLRTSSPEPASETERAVTRSPREWFEVERPHLVAVALRERTAADPAGSPAALVLAMLPFLTTRAYDDDRERLVRHALSLPGADPALEASLLNALFAVLAQRGRLDELPGVAERQLAAARRSEDPVAVVRALSQCGWAAQSRDHLERAAAWFGEAGELAQRSGQAQAHAASQGRLGVVLRNSGRADEADPLLERTVALARDDGPRRTLCIWLVTRAEGLVDLGRPGAAQELLDEAVAIATDLGDDLGLAHCRLARAVALLALGRPDDAAEQLAQAGPVLDARGPDGEDPDVLRAAADLAVARARPDDAVALLHRSVAARRRAGARVDLARDLARLQRLGARPAGGPAAGVDEVAATLSDLGLDERALRLPEHLYGRGAGAGRAPAVR